MDPVELTSPVIAVKQFKTKIERGTEIASIDYDHDRLRTELELAINRIDVLANLQYIDGIGNNSVRFANIGFDDAHRSCSRLIYFSDKLPEFSDRFLADTINVESSGLTCYAGTRVLRNEDCVKYFNNEPVVAEM